MTLSVLETSLPMQRSHDTLLPAFKPKTGVQNVTGTTGYMCVCENVIATHRGRNLKCVDVNTRIVANIHCSRFLNVL